MLCLVALDLAISSRQTTTPSTTTPGASLSSSSSSSSASSTTAVAANGNVDFVSREFELYFDVPVSSVLACMSTVCRFARNWRLINGGMSASNPILLHSARRSYRTECRPIVVGTTRVFWPSLFCFSLNLFFRFFHKRS